jgi:hypothetical protein
MNRCHRWLVCAFAVSFFLAACHDAQAQIRGSRRSLRRPRRSSINDQPSISPYLSLTNPNADPGANYAALTGPMLYQQDLSARNSQSIRRLQFDTGEAGMFGASGINTTGHSATYMNFSHYYGGGGQSGMSSSSGGFTRRSGSTGRSGGGMMGGGMMGGGMMGGGMF